MARSRCMALPSSTPTAGTTKLRAPTVPRRIAPDGCAPSCRQTACPCCSPIAAATSSLPCTQDGAVCPPVCSKRRVSALKVAPRHLLVWLGPAIGPHAFEVGDDVLNAFCDSDPGAATCFAAHRPGKWHADLYALARRRLALAGVTAIYGGGRCTHTEQACFYSYRRGGDDASGRMVTAIWRVATNG